MKWDEMTDVQRDKLIIERFKPEYNVVDFHPTSDMSDAWEVVDMIDGDVIVQKSYRPHDYCASVHRQGQRPIYSGWDNTAPEAICKAALKSVGVDIE